MLTTDPIYKRPLLPVITIKTTSGGSTLYTYSSFTGTATGITTVFPIYCTVQLSQNTHGTFTIQFEDSAKIMESSGITMGNRVIIECGKESGSITRLISGLVRTKGYTRGQDGKILYTISGPSTGIRLNELVTYNVSEAAKLTDGVTLDLTDVTRKADTLLAFSLQFLPTEAILSITNLATNSDVETFIASIAIEYGELQDVVNYIEEQSGGEVVVDTTDLVNFRHEIKNTFFGRGFTIKNKFTDAANDDADDTMYLRGKSWNYNDEFYKSSNYSNRIYTILPAEAEPTTKEELGYASSTGAMTTNSTTNEIAVRFRPTHANFLPGDLYIVGMLVNTTNDTPWVTRFRIAGPDVANSPNNLPVTANIDFAPDAFALSLLGGASDETKSHISNVQTFFNGSNARIESFVLDTTKNYWLILSNDNLPGAGRAFYWAERLMTASPLTSGNSSAGLSTNATAGTGWATGTFNNFLPVFGIPRRRALAFVMWDPKAVQNTQVGLTAGLYIDSNLSNLSAQINTKEAMYRHMASQLYSMARPHTAYTFPTVTAPNIPPFPGDPIVINDSVLGFSTSGNPVILTVCGDMTYSWGNMGSGGYEAPTSLNIQAIATHPRYR